MAQNVSNQSPSQFSTPGPSSSRSPSMALDVSNQSSSQLSTPGPNSSTSSSSSDRNADRKELTKPYQTPQRGQKIGTIEDQVKFLSLIKNFPFLYKKEIGKSDEQMTNDSWICISKKLNISVDDCKARWKAIQEKHTRLQTKDREGHGIPDKSLEFFKHAAFLRSENETRTPRNRSRAKTSTAVECNSSTPSHNSPLRSSDQSFLDGIANDLQGFTPQQKVQLKAKIAQTIADYSKSVNFE